MDLLIQNDFRGQILLQMCKDLRCVNIPIDETI